VTLTEQRGSRAELQKSTRDEFEEVRQSFLARLHGEMGRLELLANSLGAAGRDATTVFDDLATFAHRLRGAAAVFDALALSQDAKALELAAGAASSGHASKDDASVSATIRNLIDRLALMNGSHPLPLQAAQ